MKTSASTTTAGPASTTQPGTSRSVRGTGTARRPARSLAAHALEDRP